MFNWLCFFSVGALPPDLSLVILARHGEEDYVFSLLTGYWDAPAGFQVQEGLTYNPYFVGGNIGMPQQLFLDSVEYEDGKWMYVCCEFSLYKYSLYTEVKVCWLFIPCEAEGSKFVNNLHTTSEV